VRLVRTAKYYEQELKFHAKNLRIQGHISHQWIKTEVYGWSNDVLIKNFLKNFQKSRTVLHMKYCRFNLPLFFQIP